MDLEKINKFARKTLSLQDYMKFTEYLTNGRYYENVRMAGAYMDNCREAFFASLDQNMCDVEKAKAFHNSYRLYASVLEIIAHQITVKDERIVSSSPEEA